MLATRCFTVLRDIRTLVERPKVVIVVLLVLFAGPSVVSADCSTDGSCQLGCEDDKSCPSGSGCGPGETCVPYSSGTIQCISGFCSCFEGEWNCTHDCSAQCVAEIPTVVGLPTVSAWGLSVLALLLLTGIEIKFGRRPAPATSA